MQNRTLNLVLSLAISIVLMILVVVVGHAVAENGKSGVERFFILLGANFPFGIIQGLTYWIFLFGMLEILKMNKKITWEKKAYVDGLLPQKEQYVLSADDVAEIKIRAIRKNELKNYLLHNLVIKSCTSFRASKSTSEVLSNLNANARIAREQYESDQSMTRYVAWAIPSIGFIGTIIGIASALKYAGMIGGNNIKLVTDALSVAFDTTLVSLFLSLLLMYSLHSMQERLDKLSANIEEYIIENLINRIYYR